MSGAGKPQRKVDCMSCGTVGAGKVTWETGLLCGARLLELIAVWEVLQADSDMRQSAASCAMVHTMAAKGLHWHLADYAQLLAPLMPAHL